MVERTWISRELALAIHRRQLAEHGGRDGIRDPGMLDSALARPRHLLAYADHAPDVASLAAAYAYGIARNHPFVDGNERTAYVVCRTFLLLNAADMTADKQERYRLFLALAAGEVSESELAQWIRDQIKQA